MGEPLLPEDPSSLGRYRLVSRLGRGGMGTVFLGEDEAGRRVAVKVINSEYSSDVQFQRRFRREVEAARRVPRFCTAPVLDVDFEHLPWYVVTEYIQGPSLDRVVADTGPLAGADLDGLAIGIATALGAIHETGLVHRDLKPSNVLLSPVGPRVIDFGIAKEVGALAAHTGLTHTGQIVGTPAYLAPEQITGGEIASATDVFSWGCVVAYAGTGRSPFAGRILPEILHRVAYRPPDLEGLDPRLSSLVSRALDKDPARRPTVSTLLAELTGTRPMVVPPPPVTLPPQEAAPAPVPAPVPMAPRRDVRLPHDRAGKIIAAATGAALAVAGAFFFLLSDQDGRVRDKGAAVHRQDVDSRFLGTWSGPVDQTNTRDYSVNLTITGGARGEKVGQSAYPELDCSGELILLDHSADRIVVQEEIIKGVGNCDTYVQVTLIHRADGKISYFFRDVSSTGRALLTRSTAP